MSRALRWNYFDSHPRITNADTFHLLAYHERNEYDASVSQTLTLEHHTGTIVVHVPSSR